MRYWKLLGQYDAETNAYTELAVSGMASPFSPVETARLKGLRAIINRSAATSLVNHVQFKLTSASFQPNSIEVGAQGSGLQTAPVGVGGATAHSDWEVDQQVLAVIPIAVLDRIYSGSW